MATAKLICVFVFAYAKHLISHDAAHIFLIRIIYQAAKKLMFIGSDVLACEFNNHDFLIKSADLCLRAAVSDWLCCHGNKTTHRVRTIKSRSIKVVYFLKMSLACLAGKRTSQWNKLRRFKSARKFCIEFYSMLHFKKCPGGSIIARNDLPIPWHDVSAKFEPQNLSVFSKVHE